MHLKCIFDQQGAEIDKLYNIKYLNKNVNFVPKTLIYGAHEAIPCAPELSVFKTFGAHKAWSCV